MPTLTEHLSNTFRRLFRSEPAGPMVLCADDDENVRHLCAVALNKAGFTTDQARHGREVLDKLKEREYAAILLDLGMPHLHGATVLSVLGRDNPATLDRTIIVSGAPEAALSDTYGRVRAVLRKPVDVAMVVSAVKDCCDETIRLTRSPVA